MLQLFYVVYQASTEMVAGPQGHAAQITELFDVVLGYGFEIPPLDMAAYRTMPGDISTILQVMDVLDASQEEQTQLFAKELAEGQPVSCAATAIFIMLQNFLLYLTSTVQRVSCTRHQNAWQYAAQKSTILLQR